MLDGDLLSQWRGYTGGTYGYSIGFDTESLMHIVSLRNFSFGKCIYEAEVQRTIVREAIAHCVADEVAIPPRVQWGYHGPLADILFRCGVFFKDPSFEEEREWRLISSTVDFHDGQLGYRRGTSMITPFYRLPIKPEGSLPIQHVFIGPCPRMQQATSVVTGQLRRRPEDSAQKAPRRRRGRRFCSSLTPPSFLRIPVETDCMAGLRGFEPPNVSLTKRLAHQQNLAALPKLFGARSENAFCEFESSHPRHVKKRLRHAQRRMGSRFCRQIKTDEVFGTHSRAGVVLGESAVRGEAAARRTPPNGSRDDPKRSLGRIHWLRKFGLLSEPEVTADHAIKAW
jgi:hypothetical protein